MQLSQMKRRQKKQKPNKSNLFWIEVADSFPGQVPFALNFGPIVEEEVGTPAMNKVKSQL